MCPNPPQTPGQTLRLAVIAPWQKIVEEASPAAKLLASVAAVAGALWGSLFTAFLLLWGVAALWDWILGTQLAQRRSERAAKQGALPPAGGFDPDRARAGLLGKSSIGMQLSLMALGEVKLMGALGNPLVALLNAGTTLDLDPATPFAAVSTGLMVAAWVMELRSVDGNRIALGGSRLPLMTDALDFFDRVARKLVPDEPATPAEEEPGA